MKTEGIGLSRCEINRSWRMDTNPSPHEIWNQEGLEWCEWLRKGIDLIKR